MNIGQANFQPLTAQQANPTIYGIRDAIAQHLQNIQTKSQIQGMNLQNQLAQKLMPTQVSQAQQSLQSSILNNQRAQALLPYAVPDAQADLQGKQLGNTSQSLQNNLAKALIPSQIQGAGIDNDLKAAQAQYYQNGGAQGGAGVDANRLNAFRSQLKTDNPSWTPDQVNDAANQYLKGKNTFSDGSSLPEMGGQASTLADVATKSTNTAQGNNQIGYASLLDTEFKKADPLMSLASKYSGASGQASLAADIASVTAGGQATPEYAAYRQLNDQVIPAIGADIIRTEGANSTDGQKAIAILQANPIGVKSNPQVTMQQWNELKDLYAAIGKSVGTSLTVKKGNLANYGDSSNNDYSSSSSSSSSAPSKAVAALMKLHGISQQEAEGIIGESNG